MRYTLRLVHDGIVPGKVTASLWDGRNALVPVSCLTLLEARIDVALAFFIDQFQQASEVFCVGDELVLARDVNEVGFVLAKQNGATLKPDSPCPRPPSAVLA